MDCSITTPIIEAFNSFWKCEKLDENTLKIRVPYVSIVDKVVEVYLKFDNGNYVVTDGGYLSKYLASNEFGKTNKKVFDRIVDVYIEEYSISTKKEAGRIFFYKKTDNLEMLANVIFEVSDFAKSYLDALHIGAIEPKYKEDRVALKFEKNTKTELTEHYEKKEKYSIRYNVNLIPNRHFEVNATISTPKKQMNAVQFLSGGSLQHYKNKISNTDFTYRLLKDFPMLHKRFAVYDDNCETYKEEQNELDDFLGLLGKTLTKPPFPKSQISSLVEAVG